MATMLHHVQQFLNGQSNIEDNLRCGLPITVTNNENVESLITEDRRITIQQIAYVLGVSTYTVFGIIHDQLRMTKVSSR